jgi:hypothetical protein
MLTSFKQKFSNWSYRVAQANTASLYDEARLRRCASLAYSFASAARVRKKHNFNFLSLRVLRASVVNALPQFHHHGATENTETH